MKISFALAISTFVLLPLVSQAQFKAGQIFFQGGFNLSLNNSKYSNSYSDSKFGNYAHNINYSSGYFTSKNRAIGWTLNQLLSLAKSRESRSSAPSPRTLRSISFSGGRFVEHYKSLSDKFALYVRPGFALTYRLENQDGRQNGNVTYTRYQTNTVFLSINASAGIAWLVSPKWALYGGVAFANPISLSVGTTDIESTYRTYPNTVSSKNSMTNFDYNLSPSLSSGSISLGFRYLVTRDPVY